MFRFIRRYRPLLISGVLVVMAIDAFLNDQFGTGLVVSVIAVIVLVYGLYSFIQRLHSNQRYQSQLRHIRPPAQQSGLFVPPRQKDK